MMTVDLTLYSTPQSLNKARGQHWAQMRRHKKAWQADIERLMMGRLPRGRERVHASAVLRFPTRRRRDEGNFRWLLEKALGDALTNGLWLADDTPEHFTFGALTFDPELGTHLTTIRLEAD